MLLGPHCFLQIVDVELARLSDHLAAMRARLLDILLAADLGEGVKVHGPRDPSLRLPNTLSIGIPGVEARVLLEKVGGKTKRHLVIVLLSAGVARLWLATRTNIVCLAGCSTVEVWVTPHRAESYPGDGQAQIPSALLALLFARRRRRYLCLESVRMRSYE